MRNVPGMTAPTWQTTGRLGALRARDILHGYVRAVLDARTVDVNILDASPDQRERYRGSEVMHLVGAVVESAADDPVKLQALTEGLRHQHVRCFVHGRDEAGRLIAVVVPVNRNPKARVSPARS